MPNLSEYIVPSSDVQINMTFSGIPSMKLDTGSRLNWANSQSVQDIFAISHVDPIGIVALNATYTASVTMQSGEYNALMDAINAAAPAGQLYASMLEVAGFTPFAQGRLSPLGTHKFSPKILLPPFHHGKAAPQPRPLSIVFPGALW